MLTAFVGDRAEGLDVLSLRGLPRQVIVFDLEFGQPAASTPLPKSRPAFRDVLGCFGLRAAGRGLHDGGVDLLYLSHQARRQCALRRPSQPVRAHMLASKQTLTTCLGRCANNARRHFCQV